jgi:integrase
MAFAQKRGDWYRLVFSYGGKKYRSSLKTKSAEVADAVVGGVKRTIMMLKQGLLQIPAGMDVETFILSGGQSVKASSITAQSTDDKTFESITLAHLRDRYVETMSIGAIEKNSLDTVKMHIRHIIKTFGNKFQLGDLTLNSLQEHVNRRAKAKGIRGKPLSSYTIRKEIASFRAAWNWGVQAGLLKGSFPNKGLKFPKLDEKPPFQTWVEIERRIALGGLVNGLAADLWDALYLQKAEIDEMLAYLKGHATSPWLYPLVCTAAHTGARRSELLRIEIADIDFERNTILIREKKRSREKRTTRRATITPFLRQVLEDWLKAHPGGQHLFAPPHHVFRSKKRSKTTGHLGCHRAPQNQPLLSAPKPARGLGFPGTPLVDGSASFKGAGKFASNIAVLCFGQLAPTYSRGSWVS